MRRRSGERRRVGGILFATLLVMSAGTSLAQLNENCTVSILNRTTRVRADGSWRIENVPATFGGVRARATCVENAITSSGSTSLVIVIPNQPNAFDAEITLGVPDPIPDFLTLTAPVTTLNGSGTTAQLTVTATFIDRQTGDTTTSDVTAAAGGTNYNISNPAIATVSVDGLVTAVTSGTVLISALNDGALGVIQLQVVIEGADSDGDGIPDDVEVSVGLNPNDPADALLDLDSDGLTNISEFNLGAELNNPDSDGDSILDGEETIAGTDGFVTNPLLADSDGDGIRDALEIQTASDPTDPNSFNLAAALSAIQVTPTMFFLTVDPLGGQAIQQLTVTGNLIDGTTIDLTSTAKQTNYTSSNPFVCNFGLEDGQILGGADGDCTISITSNGFTTQAVGVVSNFTPIPLSFLPIPGFANNVDVSGDTTYVAAGGTGLQVVDVADRTAPTITGSVDTPGNANDVKVVGSTAFVADGAAALQIIDVSNPASPAIIAALDTSGDAWDVVVDGTQAYLADGADGLQIIDISNLNAPSLVTTVDTPGTAKGVDVDSSRNLAIVADGGSGVQVIDLTTNTIVGAAALTDDARDLVISGNFVFVAAFGASFTSVEITDPTTPVVRSATPPTFGGILNDVAFVGDIAAGADVFLVNAVLFVNVSSPESPAPGTFVDFSSLRSGNDNGRGVVMDNDFVYATMDLSNSIENGATGDSRLYIGRYRPVVDTAGVAPAITITSPLTGDTVTAGATIPMTVDATDDIGVASVFFLSDGQTFFTDTVAPFDANVDVPLGATSLTLGARALDLGGNTGVAPNVVLNVTDDPLTNVTGRVLEADLTPVLGATATVFDTFSSTTIGDGTFLIPEVPTIQGDIRVTATAMVGGESLVGISLELAPVPAGTTDLGDIILGVNPFSLYPGPKFTTANTQSFPEAAPGDLDGDGIIDLVVPAFFQTQLATLRGNGDGTFEFLETLGSVDGGEPGLLLSDFNSDGALDILAAPDSGSVVALRLGNGDGSFQARLNFGLGGLAGADILSIDVGDLNGDGFVDIVAVVETEISVRLGNGDDTFQTAMTFPAGAGAFTPLVVADVNGDGFDDVATSSFNGISVFLANSDGTLQAEQFESFGCPSCSSGEIVAADFNADGNQDLATVDCCEDPSAVWVLMGNGDGIFQPVTQITGGGLLELEAGDLNGDTFADLVSVDSPGFLVTLSNGDGSFQPTQVFEIQDAFGDMTLSDVDADGALDLVIVDFSRGGSVLLGNGDGTFRTGGTRRINVTNSSRPDFRSKVVRTADFNQDGLLDLVSPRHFFDGSGTVAVRLANPDTTYASANFNDVTVPVHDIRIVDLDGDTNLDVLAGPSSSEVNGTLFGLFGFGNGMFTLPLDLGIIDTLRAVGDVNEDSAPDILTDTTILLGNGDRTFQSPTLLPSGFGTTRLLVDLKGDQILDVVLAATPDTVTVLLGNGNGTFSVLQTVTIPANAKAANHADLNDDGSTDVVVTMKTGSTGQIAVLVGNGDGTFVVGQTFEVGRDPRDLALVDVNADGQVDAITANSGSQDVSVLLGNGDATFQPQARFAAGLFPESVVAVDVNGIGGPAVDLVVGVRETALIIPQQ